MQEGICHRNNDPSFPLQNMQLDNTTLYCNKKHQHALRKIITNVNIMTFTWLYSNLAALLSAENYLLREKLNFYHST